MYWLFAMFGALALIDISIEMTKIRKLLEKQVLDAGARR